MTSFKEELERTEFSFITPADVMRKKPRRPFARDVGISDFSRADKRTRTYMEGAEFRPERTLDLHGMTVPAAFERFLSFINENYETGTRRLLVVTGKGAQSKKEECENSEVSPSDFHSNFPIESTRSQKGGERLSIAASPDRPGAIRREFPRWLNDPLVRDRIIAISPAPSRRGSSGAFHVLLRKK
jgi:DNA-nicking Smr family endonuclease